MNNDVDNTMILDYSYLPTSRYYFYFFLQVFSASLSLIGSVTIIFLILLHRKQRWEVYHRILLALSMSDVAFDVSIILQFPMVRADTGHPLAIGNISTCSAVGFTTTLTFSMVNLFFVVLSVYFLMNVRYGKNEHQVRRYVEPYGYVFAIGLPLSICIAALLTESFNPVRVIPTCFMRPYPSNCFHNDDVPCQRGAQARPIFLFFMMCAFGTMIVGIVCTWLVYWTIRKQQSRNLRYSFMGAAALSAQEANRKRMRTIGRQAICYTAVFLNGMLASAFSSRMESIFDGGITSQNHVDDEKLARNHVVTVFLSLYLFLCPLQGLWNLVIFIRPTYIVWREIYPNESRIWALQQILKGRRMTVSPRVSHLLDGNINETKSTLERENTSKTLTASPSVRSSGLYEESARTVKGNDHPSEPPQEQEVPVQPDRGEEVLPSRRGSLRVSFACDTQQIISLDDDGIDIELPKEAAGCSVVSPVTDRVNAITITLVE